MATKEPLYRLDLVIDVKKPHWTWLQEMAALYRSVIINSNGKFKIVSERDDLPVRQVFHSGNILRDRTEVRVGRDPMQTNQITGGFSNKALDYERDILVIQDSESIITNNEPIRPLELDMTGVTRKSEVNRRLSVEMRRRAAIKNEISFHTNLQGINVEPGDVAIAGVVMNDWTMGYGGLALDGSTSTIVLDKTVQLNSGTNYDLWVWHTAGDTPEMRTVTGSIEVARLVPVTPFNYTVQAGDRWALAPMSEDLVRLLIKKVAHNPDGTTQLVGDEYVKVGFLLDCPDSAGSFADYYETPTQPWSFTMTQTHCLVCVQLHYTAPGCIGGSTIADMPDTPYINNCFRIIFPTTTNLPLPTTTNTSVLAAADFGYGFTAGSTITFISGPNSGVSRRIISYPTLLNSQAIGAAIGGGGFVMFVSPLPNRSDSGDQYYINFDQTPSFAGFRLRWMTNCFNALATTLPVKGNSACFDFTGTADSLTALIETQNSAGIFSNPYMSAFPVNIPGCINTDDRLPFSPGSITTQSVTSLLQVFIPGSEVDLEQYVQLRAFGLASDGCLSGEITKFSIGVYYSTSTYIDSFVVTLRDTNSPGLSVGSNSPFTLTSDIKMFANPASHMRVSLKYEGLAIDGTVVSTQLLSAAITSINPTITQTFAFLVKPFHTDTAGAVHSHACYNIRLDHGEIEVIETGDSE